MSEREIAYFSMEFGLASEMPTYSGGLGVLAGDMVRAAADLGVPMAGVTLLHRKGYFRQRLDESGRQTEQPVDWVITDYLTEQVARTSVTIEGRRVVLRSWKYEVLGKGDVSIPVYFLDTDLPDNSQWDRTLSHFLYGGDAHYRLAQEIVLGIGGVRMLRAVGHDTLERYHMNEGHSSLLALELLDEEVQRAGRSMPNHNDIEAVRRKCVFTTHTPVAAGHDQFPIDLVRQVLGRGEVDTMKDVFCCDDLLNMTYLALNLSHYVNGVAKKHGETARLLFAGYTIDAITNGVHPATWAVDSVAELFDRFIPGWRQDGYSLRYALSIPKQNIWQAHTIAKQRLLEYVKSQAHVTMEMDVLTIGFARRATAYKRADLLFSDIERLRTIGRKYRGLQIIFAGKAHPRDETGKEQIQRVFRARDLLYNQIKVVYLNEYNMEMGKMMTGGVDIWLNTPARPLEASGTSGMKAAVNGVPSFSVLDGWWIEGRIEGVTGWSIGSQANATEDSRGKDAADLYAKLENTIMPLYYENQDGFLDIMRHAIALNGSFFNTHRMLQQYIAKAYL